MFENLFEENFVSHFFYFPLTKKPFFIIFVIFFKNKFIRPDKIGC